MFEEFNESTISERGIVMYRLGIIEESIDSKNKLCDLASYFVSQRIENVPEDEYPVWHINEYQVAEHKITDVADMLKQHIKETWYCHAFSSERLIAVLKGKWFEISLKRDETWDEMIEYGVVHANVERRYLETIPLILRIIDPPKFYYELKLK